MFNTYSPYKYKKAAVPRDPCETIFGFSKREGVHLHGATLSNRLKADPNAPKVQFISKQHNYYKLTELLEWYASLNIPEK